MPYGSTEFSEYGPWVPFLESDSGSPYYQQQVYFDASGNEYLVGQGPIQSLQTASNVNSEVVGAVNQQMSLINGGTIPTNQPISSPTTATSGDSSSVVSSLQYLFTNDSLVPGVPNFVLMIGAALGFIWANK